MTPAPCAMLCGSMVDPPARRAAVVAWGSGGASAPPSVMPTVLALLVAALGRCRYCRPPDRCPACRSALRTVEAAFRAASQVLPTDRAAPALADAMRNAGQSASRP
jgi:hypothetical protein